MQFKLETIPFIGLVYRSAFRALAYIAKFKLESDEFRKQLVFIGYESLPMVVIFSALGTMILTVNTAVELSHHGGRELIGALIAIASSREIIPIFIAFALAARCGTAMVAETATMKVTEQIDALQVLKVDPIYYLLVPKLLASVLLAPFLLAISLITSILAGMFVAKFSIGLEATLFLESAWRIVELKEYFYPLLKLEIFVVFAVMVNIIMGFVCKGGAKEVGAVTTLATSIVIVGIIILDGILTPMLYL